jgi:hypothetical protein
MLAVEVMATSKKHGIELMVTIKPFDLKTEDDLLADAFLWGWVEPTTSTRSRSYFKKGADLEARRALIRVLQSDRPLSPTLRKHLAELFEVKSAVAERRLVIIFRDDRARSNQLKKKDIRNFYDRKLKELAGTKNAGGLAASFTAERFGTTTKTIYKHLNLKSRPASRKG